MRLAAIALFVLSTRLVAQSSEKPRTLGWVFFGPVAGRVDGESAIGGDVGFVVQQKDRFFMGRNRIIGGIFASSAVNETAALVGRVISPSDHPVSFAFGLGMSLDTELKHPTVSVPVEASVAVNGTALGYALRAFSSFNGIDPFFGVGLSLNIGRLR